MSQYLGDQKYYWGYVSEEETDHGINMIFLTSSIEYFARRLLQWGNGVEVQKPEKLKQRMGELAEELYQHYEQ